MGVERRLHVQRNRFAEWVDQLRGREPQTRSVVWEDDGKHILLHVALPDFEPAEIEVAIAPDHVVIDARADRQQRLDEKGELKTHADLHLLLPLAESVDCTRAVAVLRGRVLTVRAPRQSAGPRARRIPVKS